MIVLFVRIVLAVLAVGFAAWFSYVVYLGLKSFFDRKRETLPAARKRANNS